MAENRSTWQNESLNALDASVNSTHRDSVSRPSPSTRRATNASTGLRSNHSSFISHGSFRTQSSFRSSPSHRKSGPVQKWSEFNHPTSRAIGREGTDQLTMEERGILLEKVGDFESELRKRVVKVEKDPVQEKVEQKLEQMWVDVDLDAVTLKYLGAESIPSGTSWSEMWQERFRKAGQTGDSSLLCQPLPTPAHPEPKEAPIKQKPKPKPPEGRRPPSSKGPGKAKNRFDPAFDLAKLPLASALLRPTIPIFPENPQAPNRPLTPLASPSGRDPTPSPRHRNGKSLHPSPRGTPRKSGAPPYRLPKPPKQTAPPVEAEVPKPNFIRPVSERQKKQLEQASKIVALLGSPRRGQPQREVHPEVVQRIQQAMLTPEDEPVSWLELIPR